MSRSLPTLSATGSEFTSISQLKREKVLKEVVRKKKNPVSIYLCAEMSRKRKFNGKQYKPWYYYIDREVGSSEHTCSSLSKYVNHRTLEESVIPLDNIIKGDKKVAFDNSESDFHSERLPTITPMISNSRSDSATKKEKLNKMSAMTICTRPSPNYKSKGVDKNKRLFPRNLEEVYREYWQEDGDSYTISFRQDSREQYDPQSELHSDYYTIKRVNNNKNKKGRIKLVDNNKPKDVTFAPNTNFSAILLGTTKHLHKKHDIETVGGYGAQYIEEMTRPKVLYGMPGYSSVPLTLRNNTW